MAKKKTASKAAKPAKSGKLSPKSASRPASKPAAKKPAGKKPAPKASARKPAGSGGSGGSGSGAGGPTPVLTGKGPSPAELGKRLVEMFNQGQFAEIENLMWSPKIESIEGATPAGPGMMWSGAKSVRAKGEHWMSQHTIHGASAEGPFVGATGFAVRFKMDVEVKASGHRMLFDEVGVYTIKDGKIVREEFMYGAM